MFLICLFVCSQSQASGVVNSSVTVCDSNAAVHSSFSASIKTCRRNGVFADMSLGLKFQRSMGTHRTPVVKLGGETCVTQQEGAHKTDNDNDNDTLREVPHWSDEGLALQARASGGEKKQFGLGFLAAGREAVRHHRKEGG